MNVLVACEYSGVVRDAFRKLGHNAWSCDIIECDADPKYHIQRDVFQILDQNWDLMIAHPPCTYLCNSGTHWNRRRPERIKLQDEAADFFMALYDCNIPKIAVENPVGVMSTRFRPPDQYIEPYWFGDPYPKKTGLWLKNLPKLTPTNIIEPEVIYYNGRRFSAIHDGPPGTGHKDRAKARSKTFQGIADAMASQWG